VSESAEPLPVVSPQRPTLFWRRSYALLSVSLAVFLLSVIATVTAFHGFQFGQPPPRNANHPARTAGDTKKAISEYQQARSVMISALADYDAAKARLDDFVSEQFAHGAQSGPAIDESAQDTIQPSGAEPTVVDDRQISYRYLELQSHVTAAHRECRTALDRQNEAWQRKVQLVADQAIADQTAKLRAQTPVVDDGPLRATILWCSLFAITIGVFVGANASVSEKVFETAADVRQQLGLTVLGLLPPSLTRTNHDQPRRQPNWVRHSVRSAEFCLLALAVGLAAVCLSDQQFFTKFLGDPVAAISEKLWC
jgi:hypothetical protein